MSQFLKKLEQENSSNQEGASEEVKDQPMQEADEDEYDEEEEKGDFMSDMPLSHQPASAQPSAQAAASGGSGSSMPMPDGLIPVGNSISAGRPALPRPPPPSNILGGSSGSKTSINQLMQYSPLPWTDFFDSMEMINDTVPLFIAGTEGHVFVCLHGAGHSAMSFAVLAEKLKLTSTVVAFDWRGHGKHERGEDETNMSQETLIADTIEVLTYVHEKFSNRSLILIGHSMGGAIATKTVSQIEREMSGSELQKCILGVAIIDVVEGSAMEALPFMEQIVRNRPVHFPDEATVVKYGVIGGQVKDRRSARVSMPAQVKLVTDQPTGLQKYVWRTDLIATKEYWTEWFEGLTQTFLDLKTRKLLFLAGAERMDTELTVAHMQGKYEMHVIADCGHVIQEDQPAKICEKIMEFLERRKIPSIYNEQMFIVTAGGKKIYLNH